mmetsp:Transcript_7776/g.12371  ORF Transcript_7776/g.12371 Transcript_7776/m.12371 type:complete len:179 (+) Transcript_7776:168-704(+)|eukprot:CAMPEP_0184298708 /NCGR_PEP_ID=MMETSP1049-20130417/9463_1 /TAXON_ID=77928 /ORGANISM="Proteomonas sulcata, Strain CCMP704" /LENGTH=178 /DNA_ID=CAMNT_0026608917 /DNA_START=160 /DNA_END=696 /DNA_ORIENTATION=+
MLPRALCSLILLAVAVSAKEFDLKEEAEQWFTKQKSGVNGKKFMEKVHCDTFFKHVQEVAPEFAAKNENKLNIQSTCKKQKQVERDRRDLQDYAVKYFNDPEETELSDCKEFAEDFLSEYESSFKGEKGEAEAYCHFFKEEGQLAQLRQVQSDHKKKTRNMDDAIKTAKQIYEDNKEL